MKFFYVLHVDSNRIKPDQKGHILYGPTPEVPRTSRFVETESRQAVVAWGCGGVSVSKDTEFHFGTKTSSGNGQSTW